MIRCLICNQSYSRLDALQRHECNDHGSGKYTDQSQPLKEMTFRHPFSMMVTGPSGSGKKEWTRKLLLSSLVQPPSERILWCFGQWQPLYEDLQKRIPCIEFIRGIPDYLDNAQFMDPSKSILSYQGLRLSNLTLGLTALVFSDRIRHKPKIVTINMINHKAVQKIDKQQASR